MATANMLQDRINKLRDAECKLLQEYTQGVADFVKSLSQYLSDMRADLSLEELERMLVEIKNFQYVTNVIINAGAQNNYLTIETVYSRIIKLPQVAPIRVVESPEEINISNLSLLEIKKILRTTENTLIDHTHSVNRITGEIIDVLQNLKMPGADNLVVIKNHLINDETGEKFIDALRFCLYKTKTLVPQPY